MSRGQVLFPLLLLLLFLAAPGCSKGGQEAGCSAEQLTRDLAAAGAGQTVHLGACEVTGPFTVPSGVALEGVGDESIIHGPSGAVAVTLSPADGTRLSRLTVVSDGRAAVAAQGPGSVTVEDVSIRASVGIGIGAEGLGALTLSHVTISGAITPETAQDLEDEPDPDVTSTHGLVAFAVGETTLEDVTIEGFAALGAVLAQDEGQVASWTGGRVSGNVGAGLVILGGSATLTDVSLLENLRGPGVRAYGGIFAQDSSVESTGLEVSRNEGCGLFQYDGANGAHEDVVVTANEFGGVWVQQTDGLTIQGAASDLGDNGFAGVLAIESTNVHVADALIHDTVRATQDTPDGPVECADGFQFVRSTQVELRDLTSQFNDRIQGLFDQGGGDPTGLLITGVVVDGTETQLGCIDQNGTFPGSWDDGMQRLSGTGDRDEEFEAAGGVLAVAGIVGPQELPDLAGLRAGGLDALLQR